MSKLNPTTSPNRSRTTGRCFSFGLGCMQFLPKTRPDKLAVSQYCSDLDRFLRTIHAVTDVQVDPGFRNDVYWSGDLPFLKDNEQLWPGTYLGIRMSLHIPSRVQEEIKEGLYAETNAEDFSLTIRHCYHSPVAIIVPRSNSVAISGSSCVYLVRSFLEKVLDGEESKEFHLDMEGPSPFHADFSIREENPKEEISSRITMVHKVQLGYDEVCWHVQNAKPSFDAVVAKILDGVMNDAEIFYAIMQRRSAMLKSWIDASRVAHGVLDMEREISLGRRLRNYPRKAGRIKNAIMQVAEHEMLDIAHRAEIISMLREHIWAEDGGIRTFCEREFEGLEKFPSAQLRELLQFLENRVRHVDNVIIALLAAMVGGLVGGTLGVLVT